MALECTRHPEESIQAIGWNMLCDHRVSESRASHFFEVAGRPATVEALSKALVDYYRDWVCELPEETYLSRARNGQNFVPRSSLPKNLTLATVVNISGWIGWLKTVDGLEPRMGAIIQGLKNPLTPAPDVEALLDEFFKAINVYRDKRPIWATRWKEFQRSIDADNPGTWNAAVGVWRMPGSLQVVLRYAPPPGLQLIRPTQLDSGFQQFHFPSPPFPRATRGGFAMAPRELPVGRPLAPEWIHAPIDFNTGHWKAGLLPCGEVRRGGDASVLYYRRLHRERLDRRFRKETAGWMPAG